MIPYRKLTSSLAQARGPPESPWGNTQVDTVHTRKQNMHRSKQSHTNSWITHLKPNILVKIALYPRGKQITVTFNLRGRSLNIFTPQVEWVVWSLQFSDPGRGHSGESLLPSQVLFHYSDTSSQLSDIDPFRAKGGGQQQLGGHQEAILPRTLYDQS